MPRLTTLGLACAGAAALLLACGPWGVRRGLWSYVTGLAMLGGSLLLAASALALLVAGARQGPRPVFAGIALALVVLAIPGRALWAARGAPPIHDVTTDLADPPQFERVLALRGPGTNPVTEPDARRAARQRRAYPDLAPVLLDIPPGDAFDRIERTAEAFGWEVVTRDPARGHLEAVATTRWFAFRDDVVVRVRPAPTGASVDVRSASRVGVGDAGTNARRIRAFRDRLVGYA